jgi:hypothetical protein
MFKLDLVMSRACGDQNVSSRDRDTGGTGAPCEIKGLAPNRIVDGEFRQQPFEISKYLLITIASCAIPQLQPNDGAPTGLTGIERARNPVSDSRISIRSKHVNPG